MAAVRSFVDLKRPLHGISVDRQQSVLAVACKNDIQLIKIRSSGLSVASTVQVVQSSKSADSFVLVSVLFPSFKSLSL